MDTNKSVINIRVPATSKEFKRGWTGDKDNLRPNLNFAADLNLLGSEFPTNYYSASILLPKSILVKSLTIVG